MNTRLALAVALPALFAAGIAACTATPLSSDTPSTGVDSDASVALGSDGAVTPGPDAGAIVVAQPGAIALSVQKARRGATGATKGLVELAITLSNGAGGAAVSTNPAFFKLRGSDSLRVGGSTAAAPNLTGSACNPSGEVVAGGTYSCVLTFQLANNADAVELTYLNPLDARTAKAAVVSVEACRECGGKCGYADVDKCTLAATRVAYCLTSLANGLTSRANRFKVVPELVPINGGTKFEGRFSFTPLRVTATTLDASALVGSTFVLSDSNMSEAVGTFSLRSPLPATIPGEANPISNSVIELKDLLLAGRATDAPTYCGFLEAAIVQPQTVAGSYVFASCVFVKVNDGDALPVVSKAQYDACSRERLGGGAKIF